MSDTRYGHSGTGGGDQDRAERKDEGWESRQGGPQSRDPGSRGEPEPADARGEEPRSLPPPGTNTQGELAGIAAASRETKKEAEPAEDAADREPDDRASGTDQPPRMGGPLGPDPRQPHLPEGDQNPDTQGTGARGYDRGVNATHVGAVHQGARPEDV